MAREVGHREQDVAQFVGQPRLVDGAGGKLGVKLAQLLFDLVDDRPGFFPVEADAGRPLLDLLGPQQGGQGARHAIERAGRLGGSIGLPGRPLGGFARLPRNGLRLGRGDPGVAEELGDLLLQVAMHAEIAAEEGRFDGSQVSEAVAAKMVKRHPHVFGDVSVANADEVLRNWEHQKIHESREAGSDQSVVDRVPASLPALAWALGLQKRAARVGFEFSSPAAAAESVAEEAKELAEVTDRERAFDELGDMLFAIVSLARSMKLNPEDALRVAGQRFRQRFAAAEASLRSEGKTFTDVDQEELLRRWEESR